MSPRRRIGRFARVGRGPDQWSSLHERARVRAAERLDSALSPSEEIWLDAHLVGCEPCRATAEGFVTDRVALRQLRDEKPEPPRDLWARTAAGIERESSAGRRTPGPRRPGRATSLPALSALSGLALVVLLVVATAISGGFLGRVGRDGAAQSPAIALASLAAPQPTALAVGAGKVHWLGAGEDGAFAYNVANVDVVCPHDRQPDCAPFADGHAKRVTLTATPKFIFQSPVDAQAVVVGTDATGADAILVVPLPTPDPTPEPSVGAGSGTSPEPVGSEAPIASPGLEASPASLVPIDLPTVAPSEIAQASLASSDPASSLVPTPEPTATAVAIITDVTVVGRAAAYSPDGAWFAFSARPADGSAGPDIYVWHVGELQARALTIDHASIFASWVGGSLLGSRLSPESVIQLEASPLVEPTPDVQPSLDPSIAPDASPGVDTTVGSERLPQTFLLDPWTGAEIALVEAEWQPAVDPTGLAVVAWQGTVSIGLDGLTVAPATGNLVVHPFHGPLVSDEPGASSSPDASPVILPEVSPTLSPDASAEGSPSASTPVLTDFPAQVVATGPIADFDARWDDTGSWLAIWIADAIDPGLGRLSLLHFDPTTGLVDRPVGAPQDVTALPGFSIGLGRLAWASPPGQGGEGSRIQIAAWTSNEVGAVESIPVEGAIVVQ